MRYGTSWTLAALAISGVAGAQTQNSAGTAPSFEAASIKPNKSAGSGSSVLQDQSGNFTAENATLEMLIMSAMGYGVRDFQIVGGPGWINTERYDILAKPAAKAGRAEFQQMVQALLAERFQLKLHQESRERPVYMLSIGKNGPMLTEWKDTIGPMCKRVGGQLTCQKATMTLLAENLARLLGRSVVDGTGLTGTYDFKLEWAPDEFQVPGPSDAGQPRPATDPTGPSIFTAIQSQLGLRLEPGKGPVQVLVIDSAEKPSEN
jgi:bla regulator protein blaR1